MFWKKEPLTLQDPLKALSFHMLDVLSDEGSNTIVSPYSAFSTLLMVASIFKESTRKQIYESLKMKSNISVKDLLTSLRNMIQTIEKSTSDSIVQGANTIWPNIIMNPDMDIYKPLVEFLGAEITPVEFPQPGCDEINRKVEEITHGLIQNILSPDSIPPNTESIITNAIYFNSKWEKPFKDTSTSDSNFTRFDGTTQLTKFMYHHAKFLYAEDSDAQVLQMNYVNDFSMVVILPTKSDLNSFRALKASLSAKYQSYLNMLKSESVEVEFPKFKHTWGANSLRRMLESMGIKDIFNPAIEERHVDDIMQKAVIEVDEEKTEAAAVTLGFVTPGCIMKPEEPKRFIANHPFLYFIKHNDGSILFAGSYVQP